MAQTVTFYATFPDLGAVESGAVGGGGGGGGGGGLPGLNFGKSAIGNNFGGLGNGMVADTIRANKWTLTQGLLATQMNLYLGPTAGSGTQRFRCAIYSDQGAAQAILVAITNELVYDAAVSGTGWFVLTFPSSVNLVAADYWLALWSGATAGCAGYYFDTVTNCRDVADATYDSIASPPTPYPTGSIDNDQMSLYVSGPLSTQPVNTAAPTISGGTSGGSLLTEADGTWTGLPAPTISRQWMRLVSGGSWTPIAGATGTTFSIPAAETVGNQIRVAITGTNQTGAVTVNSAAITVTGGTAPANAGGGALPTISGAVGVGGLLTAAVGTWTGTAPIGFTFQWTRAGANITGATSPTYLVASADVGHVLAVKVTGTNAAGAATATSASTVTVPTPVAPANTTLPSIGGIPAVGQLLVPNIGAWSNTPTSFSFQWKSAATFGGTYSNIAGATGATYTPVSGDLGRFIEVVVTATNAGGSASATSAPVGAVLAASAVVTSHLSALRPSLTLELDFVAGANAALIPVWTDVTAYARDQVDTTRGRSDALNVVEAGTGSFPMENSDRRFEPEYAAGAYNPNIVPMRGARLRAVYAGVAYGIHRGYVQGWPLTWPDVKRYRSSIATSDGFEFLNGSKPTQIFGFGQTGTVINAILDAAGFSPALRLIDPGEEIVLGIDNTLDTTGGNPATALAMIQSIADSEMGLFFFDGNGNAVFHDRDHRATAARSTTLQATFGDGTPGSGELPYLVPSTDYDVTRIYNDVQVSSGLATPTTVPTDDAPSIGAYGPRTLTRSTLLQTDSAAFDQSNRILADNKDPHLRFPTLTLDPTRDARLWPVILGLEISDLVRVIRRPYASAGAAIQRDLWVEAITHSFSLGDSFSWTTTLSLSLSNPSVHWTLDSAANSFLGTTTVLR